MLIMLMLLSILLAVDIHYCVVTYEECSGAHFRCAIAARLADYHWAENRVQTGGNANSCAPVYLHGQYPNANTNNTAYDDSLKIISSTVWSRRNCIIRPNTLLMKSLLGISSEEFLKK